MLKPILHYFMALVVDFHHLSTPLKGYCMALTNEGGGEKVADKLGLFLDY
jgi:hypothetical protein